MLPRLDMQILSGTAFNSQDNDVIEVRFISEEIFSKNGNDYAIDDIELQSM